MDPTQNTPPRLVDDFKNIGKREKTIIVGILASAFFLGAVGVYQLGTLSLNSSLPADTPEQSVQEPAKQPAALFLTSNGTSFPNETSFIVTLDIDTKNQPVEAADFTVNFDSSALSVEKVETGTFFAEYPKNEIIKGAIKLSGIANLSDDSVIVPKGAGTIATLTFNAIKKGDAFISVNPDTTVVASDGLNIAGNAPSISVTITE